MLSWLNRGSQSLGIIPNPSIFTLLLHHRSSPAQPTIRHPVQLATLLKFLVLPPFSFPPTLREVHPSLLQPPINPSSNLPPLVDPDRDQGMLNHSTEYSPTHASPHYPPLRPRPQPQTTNHKPGPVATWYHPDCISIRFFVLSSLFPHIHPCLYFFLQRYLLADRWIACIACLPPPLLPSSATPRESHDRTMSIAPRAPGGPIKRALDGILVQHSRM